MSRYTLTIIDTRNIQGYVYATNNLKQNIGASYNVACAAGKWVAEILPWPNNIEDIGKGEYTKDRIEDGKLAAEVLYAGGGNVVIIFKDRDYAVDFTKKYTTCILKRAPGMDFTVVHEDFDWDGQALTEVLKDLMKRSAVKKLDRCYSHPMLGAAVTAECTFSGLPATHLDKDGRLMSSEAWSKVNAAEEAEKNLSQPEGYENFFYASEFSDIASTGNRSGYIGVVHIDGNGMSKRINTIRAKYKDSSGNRDFIDEMRSFSSDIQASVESALQESMRHLINSIDTDNFTHEGIIGNEIKIKKMEEKSETKEDPKYILPFRPIVMSGDDMTFVCDGRLALTLSQYFLSTLYEKRLPDNKPFCCRAGIAVVKSHYPFSRAYSLSEDLCASAKKYINEYKKDHPNEKQDICAMDWHFAVNGVLGGGMEEIRKREYETTDSKDQELCMRPIRVFPDGDDWRTWNVFSSLAYTFKTGDEWKDRHNKIIALREALRKGSDEVKNFLSLNNGIRLPEIINQRDMNKKGFQAGRCGYFDAIEAVDFFVKLEEGK